MIDKKEFAKLALDKNVEAFVVHVTFLSLSKSTMSIHPAIVAQITLLIVIKVKILAEYSDFSNIFLEEMILVLLEITNLNQLAIEL